MLCTIDRMPRIERPSIGADRGVLAAMLEALLSTLVAVRAQRLHLAVPELHRIAAMWLDVIGDLGRDDLAFAQAHCAQRFTLQLIAYDAMPRGFVAQFGHSFLLLRDANSLTHRSQQFMRLLRCG
jgi:hypothetical protein